MTRKDSEKDSERPHYYSQFWLDVAAGRRIIGTPKPDEEAETPEPETAQRKGRMGTPVDSSNYHADGRAESLAHPATEPVTIPDEFIEPETEDLDFSSNDVDLDIADAVVDDTDIPDMDLSIDEEEDEDELFDEEEEEEEEEEEDAGWGSGRGRKKLKPSRPVKQPPKKPGRRDSRRGGY